MISVLHMFVYNWKCCEKAQCLFSCSDEASVADAVDDNDTDDDIPLAPGK